MMSKIENSISDKNFDNYATDIKLKHLVQAGIFKAYNLKGEELNVSEINYTKFSSKKFELNRSYCSRDLEVIINFDILPEIANGFINTLSISNLIKDEIENLHLKNDLIKSYSKQEKYLRNFINELDPLYYHFNQYTIKKKRLSINIARLDFDFLLSYPNFIENWILDTITETDLIAFLEKNYTIDDNYYIRGISALIISNYCLDLIDTLKQSTSEDVLQTQDEIISDPRKNQLNAIETVYLLNELGVMDTLEKMYGIDSYRDQADIISKISGMSSENLRKRLAELSDVSKKNRLKVTDQKIESVLGKKL